MLFLADNFQEIGYGKKLTEAQWNYLVNWAGERCSKYNKKERYQYKYRDYRQEGQQYRHQQFYQYQY